jgi:PPOX class probable FMN-dependent enzyme
VGADPDQITDIAALEALYGQPGEAAMLKVADRLTLAYRRWIAASRFCLLATVGPEGTDCSPRGDLGAVARAIDAHTLALPDWRGNNRMDTLRNIVRDGRVSCLFMVPGSNTVIRVNGRAVVTTAPALLADFEVEGKHPRSVIVIRIGEVYSQCARALLRSQLWDRDQPAHDLPTPGDILAELKAGFDGRAYDADWAPRARKGMW